MSRGPRHGSGLCVGYAPPVSKSKKPTSQRRRRPRTRRRRRRRLRIPVRLRRRSARGTRRADFPVVGSPSERRPRIARCNPHPDSGYRGRWLRSLRGKGSYTLPRRSSLEAPQRSRRRLPVLPCRRLHRYPRSAPTPRRHIQGSTPPQSTPPNKQSSSCHHGYHSSPSLLSRPPC